MNILIYHYEKDSDKTTVLGGSIISIRPFVSPLNRTAVDTEIPWSEVYLMLRMNGPNKKAVAFF